MPTETYGLQVALKRFTLVSRPHTKFHGVRSELKSRVLHGNLTRESVGVPKKKVERSYIITLEPLGLWLSVHPLSMDVQWGNLTPGHNWFEWQSSPWTVVTTTNVGHWNVPPTHPTICVDLHSPMLNDCYCSHCLRIASTLELVIVILLRYVT